MNSKFKRMSESEVKLIIAELDRWSNGLLGSKLTWAMLERSSGFSRQALQARSDIKSAYDHAKRSLSGGLVASKREVEKTNEELLRDLQRSALELEEFKRKEELWRLRWQRIAFHVRQSGLQVADIDKEIPAGGKAPSERETAQILRPFDKAIPPTGRT
ncbi:hypothetical protein D3C78_1411710 [compost metagenome]